MSARISFDHEIDVLNKELEKMGTLIEIAIDKSVQAFKNQDFDLAREIIQGDRTINDVEKSIEARCLSLILKQQPVAKDLRIVSTALKVVTDMERIGDQAADIAELVLRLKGELVFNVVNHIPEMASVAKKMVHDAVAAFVSLDVKSSKETIVLDDEVDRLFNKVKKEIVDLLKTEPEHVDDFIDILMIAKYLERIGDHAVNICEWTEFHETGSLKNVRIL
ncbi:MAG: phosphate signaling complex protein PhoU [Clostridiales bacterium]|nr:phosphate signaling complex protein PhoU [Clostridiales bacterium]